MLSIDNILKSGFTFDEGEDLLQFKFRMVNSMLLISMGAMLMFTVLYYLGLNEMGDIHAWVNTLTALVSLFSLIWLRQSKHYYQRVVIVTLFAVMLSFTSALIHVPNDEFRMVWFTIGVIVAHLAVGSRFGLLMVFISIVIILGCNTLFSLGMSPLTLTTATTSLVIISLILSSYSKKFDSYEAALLQKNSELMKLVNRDELTGIMSRRYFMDMGNHYFSGSQRSKSSMSLLMLDIDYFKTINDQFGHYVGDIMLRLYCDTISRYLRKSDIFARLGGEEFGIILFETDLDGAELLAKKIRAAIEALAHQEGTATVTMTTSIGVGERRLDDRSFDTLLIRTDNALYESKSKGRNCISLAQ